MENDLIEFDKMKANVTLFVSPIKDITVVDAAGNAIAQGTLKTIKELDKQIDAALDRTLQPHKDFVKRVTAYAKEIQLPLVEAEKMIKLKQTEWANAEKIRREEELRKIEQARIEAEKKAQAERDRIALEAKKKQDAIDAELKKQQEEERKIAEAEAKKKAEAMKAFGVSQAKIKAEKDAALKAESDRQAAIREAAMNTARQQELEQNAKFEREIKQREAEYKAQQAAIEASRPKNMTTIREWTMVDPKKVPAKYWVIDTVAIGKDVRAGIITEIPGIKITARQEAVAR